MSSFHPHLLDRRLRVARAVVWAIMGLIVTVFFRTQILEHGKYRLQSELNRLRPIPLPAPRGLIMDRNGKVLAENVPGYAVSLLPGDEDSLRGADGVRFVEVSALGRVVREAGAASTLAPVSGQPLRTTIDLDLQRYVAQIFPAGQRGAVLALNPNTGEILALYSAPGFDPNSLVGGIEAATWRRLNESESHPLFDRSIQARYPPGSSWKLAVAAIALKRGLVTFHSHMPIPCRGGLQYGNRFFRCWSAQGHGDLALADAIAQSCDVFFYQLGLKIGLSSLLEEANGIGFHTRTGVDLPGEITPEFPTGTE